MPYRRSRLQNYYEELFGDKPSNGDTDQDRRETLKGGTDHDRSRTITQEQLEHAHDSNAYDLAMYEANQDAPASTERKPFVYVPPPVIYLAFDRHKAEAHIEHVRRTRESVRIRQSASGGAQTADELPDIDELKSRYVAGVGEITIHPVDIEAQIAAQHNELLKEVLQICQYEGVPSILRNQPDIFLGLCADYGMDEEKDAEARAYLACLTQKLLGSDFRQQSMYNPMFLANDLWEEAHATHTTWKDDEAKEGEKTSYNSSFEAYREQVEATYGVQFTAATGATEWDLVNVRMVHVELENVARIFGERLRAMTGLFVDDATAFRLILAR